MKWQAVITGELVDKAGSREVPRPSDGAGRDARARRSAHRLPAHACLALVMLSSVIGARKP